MIFRVRGYDTVRSVRPLIADGDIVYGRAHASAGEDYGTGDA
jgi:hypothetical protein